MCLVTRQQEALVAEEDITVYKILRKDLTTIYQEFEYELGKLYSTEIKVEELGQYSPYFDSIVERKYNIINTRDFNFTTDLKSISIGYHSGTLDRLIDIVGRHYNVCIFKCTIPKGSEYFKDETGLFVSNQIIINELNMEK